MRREQPIAGSLVVEAFKEREQKALTMIKNSGITYLEVGLFGSYARNEYKATSDIDILIIVNEFPSWSIRSDLRCDLDMIDVDAHFMTKEYFEHDDSRFTRHVRKDYLKLL